MCHLYSNVLVVVALEQDHRVHYFSKSNLKKKKIDMSAPPVDVVLRMFTVGPSLRECFRMRLLLCHVRGPACFGDMKRVLDATNDGAFITYCTFRKHRAVAIEG